MYFKNNDMREATEVSENTWFFGRINSNLKKLDARERFKVQ